ncbi:MAG: hypothetical protein KDE51_17160, partial [Anaerolineales bacterium]|nr:hypothetical protein [Anaerolineales bacterium]
GVLNAGVDEPYAFPPEDISLAESMAEATALAIANATFFEAVSTAHGRLDAVIENNNNSIIMVGLNKRILVINQTALEQLRLPGEQKDWQGRAIYDVVDEIEHFAPEAAVALRTEVDRIRMGDEEWSEGEVEINPHILQWSNAPVMVEGRSRGRLYMLRDVTEEWALERMREDLIHTMVHDLRNPLHMIASGISFLSDILTEDYNIGNSEKQVLEISMANTDRLISLVNAILDINQLESGKLPLKYDTFSIVDPIKNIFHRFEPHAAERHIEFKMDMEPMTTKVWADPTIIERVLENLIGNALKFTPDEGYIEVKTELLSESKAVKILVKDSGKGIDPEIRNNIFEKFTTSAYGGKKGNGLGLAFCKMALEAHKQKIWIEETSAEGSTFAFTLAVPQLEPVESVA